MWQLKNLQHVVQNFLGQKGVWNGTSFNLIRIYYLSSSQDNELKDTVVLIKIGTFSFKVTIGKGGSMGQFCPLSLSKVADRPKDMSDSSSFP